jgi:predicted nucleic acid-binding protein
MAEQRRKNREYQRTAQLKKAIENPRLPDAEARHRARIAEELARPAFRDPFIAALFGEYQGAAA